jgi:hypothetical protein
LALAANGQPPALAKEHPFPPQILSAKTIAIVSSYGLVPSAHNPLKGSKFKRDAEAVLRTSQRFTLLDDPAKSDLVLLLVGGYSEEWLGFKEHIVTGAVFSGGAQASWSAVPLWIAIQDSTLRTHSAAAALSKAFLKEVDKASQSAATVAPAPPEEATAPEVEPSEDSSAGGQLSLANPQEASWLPAEILHARKVMVILRIDTTVGPKGEEKEKNVERELKKWGRFSLVTKPQDADLLIVCVRFLQSGLHSYHTYENMLIFKGGSKELQWDRMPLWTNMQIEALFRPALGAEMVRWLRKQIERQESARAALIKAP